MADKNKLLLKVKEQIELIDVDIFDLKEDLILHNTSFLTMVGGLIVLSIGIFVNLSNKGILFALIGLLIICSFGVSQFFKEMGKIEKKLNVLSKKKKRLIKKKYELIS